MRSRCEEKQTSRMHDYVISQMPKSMVKAKRKNIDSHDCQDSELESDHDSGEEKQDKVELDKSKNKFLYSKDLVKKFPHA